MAGELHKTSSVDRSPISAEGVLTPLMISPALSPHAALGPTLVGAGCLKLPGASTLIAPSTTTTVTNTKLPNSPIKLV